jgi:hypothetical protein
VCNRASAVCAVAVACVLVVAFTLSGCETAPRTSDSLTADADALERERQRVLRNLAELDREISAREAADRTDPRAALDVSVREHAAGSNPPLLLIDQNKTTENTEGTEKSRRD